MKYCRNCGTQLQESMMFCGSCGANINTGTAAPRKTGGLALPDFLMAFLKSPSKAIKEKTVSPALAIIVLVLMPVSMFLSSYATIWRAITDQIQVAGTYIDGRWHTATEIRAHILSEQFNMGAGFGSTVLHALISFCLFLAVIVIVMKCLGHSENFDVGQLFYLMAFITIVNTAFYFILALVTLVSSSWGGYMIGLTHFTLNGHSEQLPLMPHNSILLAAVICVLLYLVVKRVFNASTEKTITAIVIASLVNWTYQAFAAERILYALYN